MVGAWGLDLLIIPTAYQEIHDRRNEYITGGLVNFMVKITNGKDKERPKRGPRDDGIPEILILVDGHLSYMK